MHDSRPKLTQELLGSLTLPATAGSQAHPGVLDVPEGLAALSPVAGHQDPVVQSSAAWAIKDATVVQLELPLVGLNGHRHGLVGHSLHMGREATSAGSTVHMQGCPLAADKLMLLFANSGVRHTLLQLKTHDVTAVCKGG